MADRTRSLWKTISGELDLLFQICQPLQYEACRGGAPPSLAQFRSDQPESVGGFWIALCRFESVKIQLPQVKAACQPENYPARERA